MAANYNVSVICLIRYPNRTQHQRKRKQLCEENGLWLRRASKRKRKERTVERTEKEKSMQSDFVRLEKEEDEEVWDNRKGKQQIGKSHNETVEIEEENDERLDRGIWNQGDPGRIELAKT
ncbi:hypothetical protein OUZ56_009977 [Daphnia magna]|uniref:Uncharacterized protein n=1 Tax=Daphnia magna TaxID=35525 RepID=A0ABR0AHF8_9CRUS|nr:hypothetical protein OUZ56_009977 [Daphnia magna]